MSTAVETGRAGGGIAYVAVTFDLGLAVALWAMRTFGGEKVVHEAEWGIGGLALASVYALPAFVGIIALRGREHLFGTAGMLSLVLSVSLFSIVTLPLVIPGVLFLVAGSRVERGSRRGGRALTVAFVTVIAAAAALGVLVFTPSDTVCWRETRYADGRTVIVRDHVSERQSSTGSHMMSVGPPSADVVSDGGGCTDAVFPPGRSMLALSLVAMATLVSWKIA